MSDDPGPDLPPSPFTIMFFLTALILIPANAVTLFVGIARQSWYLVYIVALVSILQILALLFAWITNVIHAGHLAKALKGRK